MCDGVCLFIRQVCKEIGRKKAAMLVDPSPDRMLGKLSNERWLASFVVYVTERICPDEVRLSSGMV